MQRLSALLVAGVLLLSACGGGDDVAADTTVAPTTTTAPTTTQPPATTTTAAPTTTLATTTTASPTTTTAAPGGIVAGEDPDVDAIVLAYSIAFDSESDFATKSAYIDDPAGLEETVDAYLAVGDSFGGVSVEVAAVTVEGDAAEVSYDLLFGGNPTYPDLSGTAVLTDDGWKVPRTVFCSLMSAARVGCP